VISSMKLPSRLLGTCYANQISRTCSWICCSRASSCWTSISCLSQTMDIHTKRLPHSCCWLCCVGSTTWDALAWDDVPFPSPLLLLLLLRCCLLQTRGHVACLSANALYVMVSLPALNLSGLSYISTQHKTMQKINDFHRDIVSFLTN